MTQRIVPCGRCQAEAAPRCASEGIAGQMALCLPVHVGEDSRLTLLGVSLTVWKACASPPVPKRLSLLLAKKGKWSIGIAVSHIHSRAGFQLRCKLGWTDAVNSHRISCSGQLKICLQMRWYVSPKGTQPSGSLVMQSRADAAHLLQTNVKPFICAYIKICSVHGLHECILSA